jgi:plasmid stability protein
MPANLSIRNVPDDVLRGLSNRAASNQRTLNAELLDILRQAAQGQGEVSIDTLLERAQKPKPALDEAASKIIAAHDAQQESVATRASRIDAPDRGRQSAGAGETAWLPLVGQAVADSLLGQQVSGLSRIVFQLAAQAGHVHPRVVGL